MTTEQPTETSISNGACSASVVNGTSATEDDEEDVDAKREREDDTQRNWALTTEYVKTDAELTLVSNHFIVALDFLLVYDFF